MRKYFVLLVTVLFFISNWLVDIGENMYRNDTCVNNGFYRICDGGVYFHAAWYTSMILFCVMAFFALKWGVPE